MLFDTLLEESITENIEIPSDWEKMSDSDFFSMSDSVLVKRSIPGARFENAGSSRSVWVVGNRALKLAMNQFGVKQNREEAKIGRAGYKHFTRVFEFDPKFRWLVCELAEPILGREFKEYFGVGIDELGISLRYLQAGSSATEPLGGSKPSLRKLLRPIVARQLQSGDSTKLSSWGKVFRNGKMVPVILDYGFAGFHYYDDLPSSIASGLSPGNKRFYKGRPKDLLAKYPLQLRRIKENWDPIGSMIDEYTGWMRKDGEFFELGNFETHEDLARVDGCDIGEYFNLGFVRVSAFKTNSGKREIWGGNDFRNLNSREIKNLIDLAIEGGFDVAAVDMGERDVWTRKDDLNESYYGWKKAWMDPFGKLYELANVIWDHDDWAKNNGLKGADNLVEKDWIRVIIQDSTLYADSWVRRRCTNKQFDSLLVVAVQQGCKVIKFEGPHGQDTIWKQDFLGESAPERWVKAWMSPKAEIFPLEYSETHEEWIKEYYGDYEKAMRFGWSRLVIGDYGSELIIENKLKTLNRNQMDELMVLAVKKNVKRVYYDGPSGFNIIWKEDFGRDSFSRAVGECIGEASSSGDCKIWMKPNGDVFQVEHGRDHDSWIQNREGIDQFEAMARGWLRIIIVQKEMLVENPSREISRKQAMEVMILAAKRRVERIFNDGPNGYDTFWEAEDAPGWAD